MNGGRAEGLAVTLTDSRVKVKLTMLKRNRMLVGVVVSHCTNNRNKVFTPKAKRA